jgi:acetyltransferase-like isoleucine patch superfamily enzyme
MHGENALIGLKNRILQLIAMVSPGAQSTRIWCHRMRGVEMGEDVWIGSGAMIENAYPWLVSIGNRVIIGVRVTIIAHFHEVQGVSIGDDVFVGPGVIILPGTKIGAGAVVTAGSVVTTSVPSGIMAQGNPARPVAKCGIPLGFRTSGREFAKHLRSLK